MHANETTQAAWNLKTSCQNGLDSWDLESGLFNWARRVGQSARFWAGAIIAGFLIWNLANIHEYGLSYDEPIGMRRGEETTRLFQSLLTGAAPDYSLTYATYQLYPSFYAFLNYQCAEFLKNLGLAPIAAGHVLNLFTATFGLLILFLFSSRIYGDRVALWAVLFLALFPRFVAHAHYNGKDLPVMVFWLLTVYLLYLARESGKANLWMLAGISFGLSINAKLDALLIFPVFFGAWVIDLFKNRSYSLKETAHYGCIFVYSGIVTAFVLWPLLWIDPLLLFKAVHHFSGAFHQNNASYLGNSVPIADLPWHYMPMHLLAVTPLPVLFCLGLGVVLVMKGLQKRQFISALLALWVGLPLLIRLYPGSLQYDGMRHVFLVVPALMIFGAVGFDSVLFALNSQSGICGSRLGQLGAMLRGGLILAQSLWLGIENSRAHPYQGSYLNEGVRLFVPSSQWGEYFDFYSWGTNLHKGVKWINANAEPGDRIYAPNQRGHLQYYFVRRDLTLTDSGPAEWILLPGWRRDLPELFVESPAFAAQFHEGDLLRIYKLRY